MINGPTWGKNMCLCITADAHTVHEAIVVFEH